MHDKSAKMCTKKLPKYAQSFNKFSWTRKILDRHGFLKRYLTQFKGEIKSKLFLLHYYLFGYKKYFYLLDRYYLLDFVHNNGWPWFFPVFPLRVVGVNRRKHIRKNGLFLIVLHKTIQICIFWEKCPNMH